MFQCTGCDGIMIARGAQGNPWIFKSILEGKDYNPTVSERFDVIFKHISYALEFEDQRQVNMKMRKHIAWYLKGLDGSTRIKDMVNRASNVDEVKEILKNYQFELEKEIL
jgi:tRNA-dihydrouridine synthase B